MVTRSRILSTIFISSVAILIAVLTLVFWQGAPGSSSVLAGSIGDVPGAQPAQDPIIGMWIEGNKKLDFYVENNSLMCVREDYPLTHYVGSIYPVSTTSDTVDLGYDGQGFKSVETTVYHVGTGRVTLYYGFVNGELFRLIPNTSKYGTDAAYFRAGQLTRL